MNQSAISDNTSVISFGLLERLARRHNRRAQAFLAGRREERAGGMAVPIEPAGPQAFWHAPSCPCGPDAA